MACWLSLMPHTAKEARKSESLAEEEEPVEHARAVSTSVTGATDAES